MDIPQVYLCGSITPNLVHLEWRKIIEQNLSNYNIGVLSPTRNKEPKDWQPNGLEGLENTIYSKGGFVAKDRRDVERSDALLLAFTKDMDPGRQSIGTWVEMGWAICLNIPIVVWSDMPEIIGHPFVYKHAAKICSTLDEATNYLVYLLS